MGFKRKADLKGNVLHIKVSGPLNESMDFGQYLYEALKCIEIDLRGVNFINSTGIRKWIAWFAELKERNAEIAVHFYHCPKVVVDQMNQVKGFLPAGSNVHSIDLPYWCDNCKETSFVLIDIKKHLVKQQDTGIFSVQNESYSCKNCQTLLKPDYFPKYYFQFLNLP